MQEAVKQLLQFLNDSPSTFHAVENLRCHLMEAGYTALSEGEAWALQPGGKYFVTRNGTSLLAFRIPQGAPKGFTLAASHADSPTFKVKENPEKTVCGHYVQLNTEKYGGMLMGSWFDRPLSVAGRLLVEEDGKLVTKLVCIDRDLLIIPSVAIHMNRAANDGVKLLANVDTLPLFTDAGSGASLLAIAAESVGAAQEQIVGHDLSLYVREAAAVLGANEEYISAPRLDDLECVWTTMQGFLQAEDTDRIPVCCVFDNEEVGSDTKQGAASNFLRDTLRRITQNLGLGEEEYLRLLANSFMASCDNAHAMHPNHPEYSDAENCPWLNGGVVIKFNANQKYTTDGVSAAIFRSICKKAGVKVQVFANRADLPGGSTLGSIANTRVAVPTVDIGLAQLAMHSCRETAGAEDVPAMVEAMRQLFSARLTVSGGTITIE